MKHNLKATTKAVAASSELRNNAFIEADESNSNGRHVRFKETIVNPRVGRSARLRSNDVTEYDLSLLTTMVSTLQVGGHATEAARGSSSLRNAKGSSTAATTTPACSNFNAISAAPTPPPSPATFGRYEDVVFSPKKEMLLSVKRSSRIRKADPQADLSR